MVTVSKEPLVLRKQFRRVSAMFAAQTACATTYPPDFTHQNPPGLIVYFYNNPSHCLTHFNSDVSLQSILEREPFSAKAKA
jgi:hypothetical protein